MISIKGGTGTVFILTLITEDIRCTSWTLSFISSCLLSNLSLWLYQQHRPHSMHLASGGAGKISAPENITYSGPEKCWKFLNILITSLVQNMLGMVYIYIFHFRISVE